MFLPNANLNPDFQKCIAFGEVSQPQPRVRLGKRKHHSHPFLCANTPYFGLSHGSYPTRLETHWYTVANKIILPSIPIDGTKTPKATKATVDPSVVQPSNNFYLCNKINKYICIKYISPNLINYQHVSITFVIIIGVALQEYLEYNNLTHWILGNTQCLKHLVVPFTLFCSILYS
jgi:hypothetical protein